MAIVSVAPTSSAVRQRIWSRALLLVSCLLSAPAAGAEQPLFRAVELDIGESADVVLGDGKSARVKLVGVRETHDTFPQKGLRRSDVQVEVNGASGELVVGEYNLPVVIGGTQIDSPVTNSYKDYTEPGFGITKRVRLRLWPAGSPWMPPGSMLYPILQRFFVTDTWYNNEPIDYGDLTTVAYHSGLDMGGTEAMVDVVAATDGVVVRANGKTSSKLGTDHPLPADTDRTDVVYIRDARDWYYRYSHLYSTDAETIALLDQPIKAGHKIGVMGKQGASGGWSHTHFEIFGKQPSGKWGCIGAYPFAWEAYLRQYSPPIIAVARPRKLAMVGETITLDGSHSWSASGPITRWDWTFADGMTRSGAQVMRSYDKAGSYAEVLTVHDEAGHVSRDFTVVAVVDRTKRIMAPWLHVTFAPSFDKKPGDPVRPGVEVTFKARVFDGDRGVNTDDEHWDFGDGSAAATTHSDVTKEALDPDGYAVIRHTFAKPGYYVVRVERTNPSTGLKGIAQIPIEIGFLPTTSDGGVPAVRDAAGDPSRTDGQGAGASDGAAVAETGNSPAEDGDVTSNASGASSCGCRLGAPTPLGGGFAGLVLLGAVLGVVRAGRRAARSAGARCRRWSRP